MQNPAYLPALVQAATATGVAQLLTQVASPAHPAITPGNVFLAGTSANPLRAGWDGSRGVSRPVSFENRYGALCGHRHRPLDGAHDLHRRAAHPAVPRRGDHRGAPCRAPGMYAWLAEDLAERGYVVLTYDVRGQGTSENPPHQDPPSGRPWATRTRCPSTATRSPPRGR